MRSDAGHSIDPTIAKRHAQRGRDHKHHLPTPLEEQITNGLFELAPLSLVDERVQVNGFTMYSTPSATRRLGEE